MKEIVKLGAQLAHELIDLLANELIKEKKEKKKNAGREKKLSVNNRKRGGNRSGIAD